MWLLTFARQTHGDCDIANVLYVLLVYADLWRFPVVATAAADIELRLKYALV